MMSQKFFLAADMDSRLFYSILAVSFVAHGTLIAGSSLLTHRIKIFAKPVKPIEVTYETIHEEPRKQPQNSFKEVQIVKSKELPPELPVDVKVISRKPDIFSLMRNDLRELTRPAQRVEPSEKQMPSIKSLGGERKITVPLLQSEKMTNPKYLGYTQGIRQSIERRAYYYARSSDFASGEVYLTFVLTSAGALGAVKIIPEKTHANAYLQNIGIRSIQESAPFPPFPPDLAFPELTFNVIISFELEE